MIKPTSVDLYTAILFLSSSDPEYNGHIAEKNLQLAEERERHGKGYWSTVHTDKHEAPPCSINIISRARTDRHIISAQRSNNWLRNSSQGFIAFELNTSN